MSNTSNSSSDAEDDVAEVTPRYVPPADNRRPSILYDRMYVAGAGYEPPNQTHASSIYGNNTKGQREENRSKDKPNGIYGAGMSGRSLATLTPANRVGMANGTNATPSRQRVKPPLKAETYHLGEGKFDSPMNGHDEKDQGYLTLHQSNLEIPRERILIPFWNKVKASEAKKCAKGEKVIETASNSTVASDTLDSKIRYLHGRTVALADKERGNPRSSKKNYPSAPWTGGGGDYQQFVGTKGTRYNPLNTNVYKQNTESEVTPAFDDHPERPSPSSTIHNSHNNKYEIAVKEARENEENKRLQRKVDRDRMTKALQQASGRIRREAILSRNPRVVEREAFLSASRSTPRPQVHTHNDPLAPLGPLDYDYVPGNEQRHIDSASQPKGFCSDAVEKEYNQNIKMQLNDSVEGLEHLEQSDEQRSRQREKLLSDLKANAYALTLDKSYTKDVNVIDPLTGRRHPRMYSVENDVDSDSSSDAEYFSLDFKPASVMASLDAARPRYNVPKAKLFSIDKRVLNEMKEKVREENEKNNRPKQIYSTSCGPVTARTEIVGSNANIANATTSASPRTDNNKSTEPNRKALRPQSAPLCGRVSQTLEKDARQKTERDELLLAQHQRRSETLFVEAIPRSLFKTSSGTKPRSVNEHLNFLKRAEAFDKGAVLHAGERRGPDTATPSEDARSSVRIGASDDVPGPSRKTVEKGGDCTYSILQDELDKRRSVAGSVMSTGGGLLTVNVGTPNAQIIPSISESRASQPTPYLRVYDDNGDSSDDRVDIGRTSALTTRKSSASIAAPPSSVGYSVGCDTPRAVSSVSDTVAGGDRKVSQAGGTSSTLASAQTYGASPLIIPTRPSASSRPPTATRRPQSATVRR